MVINHLEKLFVTSDASTIVTEMDVYHPAAKLLVMAAKAQAGEVGDGTNLVSEAVEPLTPRINYFSSCDLVSCLHQSGGGEVVQGRHATCPVCRGSAVWLLCDV